METLLLFSLLTSAMFYLGSRATITRGLWSKYPPKLARFMDCAACSGAWYGAIVGLFAHLLHFGAVGILNGPEWYSPIVVMLCSIVWTPIVSGYMQRGFEMLGSAVGEDGDAQ
jgi:hypothetical protein